MASHWETADIAVITFERDGARVNLIDEAFVEQLEAEISKIAASRCRGLIFRSGISGQFIAGADVGLIATLRTAEEAEAKARQGQQLFEKIARLPFPTIAAIAGPCLGGGMELALACTYRVCADSDRVQFGLPEVRLGILPGFGGTVRLPRLVGMLEAIQITTTGRSVRPKEALRLGLVNGVVPEEHLMQRALQWIDHPPAPSPRGISRRLVESVAGGSAWGRNIAHSLVSRQVQKTTQGHYPAPERIVDRLFDGRGRPIEEALAKEAHEFGLLAETRVARNLLWLFQANESIGRSENGKSSHVPEPRVQRVVVAGAGTMGGGIAGLLADCGIDVRLRDVAIEPLRVGLSVAAAPLASRVRKKRLSPRERDAILARISPTTELTGIGRADAVIEAVPEVLQLKIKVLRELENHVSAKALMATNTSSLPIRSIAEGLRDPSRLLGIHFFNPVHRMPLVEIIPGPDTTASSIARAVQLVRALRKSPLVVSDSPGFLVNRLLMPYLNEAAHAVHEGWRVEWIDEALERFGMPMGPLRVVDEVGLDVARHVARVLEEAFGERAKASPLLEQLIERGALGTKAGRGFYRHVGRKRWVNREDLQLGQDRATKPSDNDIVDRMLLGMVLEAARCWSERVVRDPGHLDLGMILGAGFPPFTGGVRRWALARGESEIRRRLDGLQNIYGPRFAPGPELAELFLDGARASM